jgi:DNA-binding winged helix-turn-helix (wHTH) protein/tetratricopeptide (TPR) repeat protein
MALAFGSFEIDSELRELRHEGREVVVQPLIFDLLLHFVRHPNVLLTREDLVRDVWRGVVVGDGSITQAISLLRRTLRPDDAASWSIRTVRGRGYRFVASVREAGGGDVSSATPHAVRPWPGHAPFVGRDSVMALLAGALEEARRGETRVVLLSGEPGIGKTRTCVEFGRVVEERGMRVFVTHVPETGGAPSYWPWVELIRQALATAAPALRADPRTAALCDAMIPERRRAEDAAREVPPYERERARFELFERVASFWTAVAADGPVVLIVDDVHRADVESLELLDFVAQRAARVVFVVTLRPPAILADEARAHALGVLARRPDAVSEQLQRLSRADVAELVGLLTGEPCDEALATSLLDRSGGNPFLLKELVWLWLRRPVDAGRDGAPDLPAALLPAIERHLDVVSAACRKVLAAASVIGRAFAVLVLVASGDVPAGAVTACIDEAVRAEVVAPLSPGRFQFVHALVRDAVYEALSTPERIALHARVGQAIEATYGAGDEHVAALAHHFGEAVTVGEAKRALAYATRAAQVATRASAFREAVAHYRRAIEIAPLAETDEEVLLRLQVGLAEVAADAGDFETVRQVAGAAMDRARRLGDALAFARAADCFSRGSDTDLADPAVTRAIEEALAHHPDEDALRVRLLSRLAHAKWFAAPPAVARACAEAAVDAGRRVGDPDAHVLALTRAYRILLGPADRMPLRAQLTHELLDVLPRVRGPAARLDCRWHVLADAVERGDRIAFDQRVDAMLHEAAESPHPVAGWYASFSRTARLHLAGCFPEAEAEARRGVALAAPADANFSAHVFALQMIGIRLAEGRFDEHVDELRSQVGAHKPPTWRIYLALGEVMRGRTRDADRLFTAFVADDLAALPRDVNWTFSLVPLAELCVALGRAGDAGPLLRHLTPFAERHDMIGAAWLHNGAIARRLGLLAGLLGRQDDAERFIRDGIERDARMGAPAFAARGRVELARLLRRRGGRAARAEAAGLLESAVADATRLGLARLRAEADTLMGR